jgi:hypothetical protein
VRHRTATVHCPVRATSAQPLGFGAVDCWRRLSSSCTGQSGAIPDSATPDSSVPSDFCALTSVEALSTAERFLQSTVGSSLVVAPVAHRAVRCHTRQSGGTPDSPVNYSGAHLQILESGWFAVIRAWCTRHCPVRQNSAHSCLFALF